MNRTVVIDACVLVDVFVASRPRHPAAEQLAGVLKARGVGVRVPMHALFEVAAAMQQEKHTNTGLKFARAFTAAAPFEAEFVNIDDRFFSKYYSESLPVLRAGDLIYVALAKGDGLPLITEDTRLLDAARQAGVTSFRIADYLAGHG